MDFLITKMATSRIERAVEDEDLEQLRELLLGNTDNLDNAMKIAIDKGNGEIISLLIRYGANLNVERNTDLHIAVQSGNIDLVEELIRNGASVNRWDNRGYRPLHFACNKGIRMKLS